MWRQSSSWYSEPLCVLDIVYLDTDPDPAFQVSLDPIRVQGFDDQKLKKKIGTAEIFFYIVFDQKL
jgi:hypothetical protein